MGFAIATATTDMRAVLEARIQSVWVTDLSKSATAIRWGNTGIDPPPNAVWMRASVILGESEPTINGPDVKPSILQLDFFGPKNKGDAALLALCDAFKAEFQKTGVGGIYCFAVDGPRDVFDPAWSRQMLRVRFQYFEIT